MKQLITIETIQPTITADFEAAKKRLQRELKKYDVVVTVDTVGDAKKLSTELNKTASDIDAKRKTAVASVSEPIKAFDENMKALVVMCKDGRKNLLDQIKKFEDETRKEVEVLLRDKRAELWDVHKVDDEFKSAEFDDLILLTSITAKGSLTAKARTALEQRVNADLAKQQAVTMRLLELENKSYRAGLRVPLERTHVERFLFLDEETYGFELASLLRVEVERQHKNDELAAKEKARETAINNEAEASVSASMPAKDAPAPEVEAPIVEKPAANKVQSKPPKGKVSWLVTVTFDVAVAEHITQQQIESKLTDMLTDAGISSMSKIEATKCLS